MPAPFLFNYYIATQPQPLQAGDQSVQSNGSINVHIAAPSGGGAFANQITIAVPVGAGGVFQQTPACTINTGKWVITSSKKVKGKTIGMTANQDYAQFIIECQNQADYGITYNLVVAMAGAVTSQEGSYDMQVLENSGTTNTPGSFTPKKGPFTVAVVPPQFYVSNLVAFATGAPTVPKTEFAAAADINLSWESNGTWFQVYKKGDSTPFFTGTATTCLLSGGVSTDTTFFLVASMTGDPTGDSPSFETVYLFDSITVTITNPVLTPTSVTTSGAVTVGGNLSVTGTANVAGQTTLGTATINTLTTTGAATLGSASVTGPLSVSGAATLLATSVGSLAVSGGATINGGLTASGSAVSMLTGAVGVNPGTYNAVTDGFVIGWVAGPSAGAGYRCICWISGNTENVAVWATGGNIGCFDSNWTKSQAFNNQSFTMPVRKGQNWSIGAQVPQNFNEQSAPTAFYWFPLGNNAGAATIKRISDEQSKVPAGVARTVQRISKPKDEYVAELIEVIVALADKPVPAKLRKRLVNVLTKLNSDEYEEITGE